jgi:hypothetical protein
VPTPAAPETLPARNPETKKFSNPPRPSYPDEFLTHSFKPYGCYPVSQKDSEESMDVDVPATAEKGEKSSQKAKGDEEGGDVEVKKEKKGKKRKTAPDEPVEDVSVVPKKKSKKTKSS